MVLPSSSMLIAEEPKVEKKIEEQLEDILKDTSSLTENVLVLIIRTLKNYYYLSGRNDRLDDPDDRGLLGAMEKTGNYLNKEQKNADELEQGKDDGGRKVRFGAVINEIDEEDEEEEDYDKNKRNSSKEKDAKNHNFLMSVDKSNIVSFNNFTKIETEANQEQNELK